MPHVPGTGAIFGIVSKNGVAKVASPVNLYDRTNGNEVMRQLTDANGGFVFNGLNQATSDYMVAATDEDAVTPLNAIIADRIQPVPGYQGATYWMNWHRYANSKNALFMFDGRTDQTNKRYIAPYSASGVGQQWATLSATTATPTFAASITPGAPQIPGTTLNNTKLLVRPRMLPAGFGPGVTSPQGINSNPSVLTFELVTNFATLRDGTSPTGKVNFAVSAYYQAQVPDSSAGVGASYTSFYFMTYDPAAQVLHFYRNNGTTNVGNLDSSIVEIGTGLSMASYQGVHHLAVTLAYGSQMQVYIDATLVQTVSLASTPAFWLGYNDSASYGYPAIITVYGATTSAVGSNALGANATIGAIAVYPSILSATDITNQYNNLMVGTTPLMTGYAKEVFSDLPYFYSRLNDANTATSINTETRFGVTAFNGSIVSAPVFQQPTIITGSAGIKFGGGTCIKFAAGDGGTMQNPYGYTIEWVGSPTAATPAAVETLFANFNSGNTAVAFQVQRQTNGKLTLLEYCSGTETLNFATTYSTTSTTQHYAIVVDKVALTATLYVNGVQVEQIATSTTLMDTTLGLVTFNWGFLSVGANVNTANAVTSPHAGVLAELAFFPLPLPAARIAAHYAARTIA